MIARTYGAFAAPAYKMGDQVATREAYGVAIAKLGAADPRVVALDADVKNSTFSDKFEAALPEEFARPYRAALTRLQEAAPPLPARSVHAVLAAELGPRWRQRFRELDDTPAAAASIGAPVLLRTSTRLNGIHMPVSEMRTMTRAGTKTLRAAETPKRSTASSKRYRDM